MSTMATRNGIVRHHADAKRRRMSMSSGLGLLGGVTVRGSSAMPQIGQAPGRVANDLRMHRAGVFDLWRNGGVLSTEC